MVLASAEIARLRQQVKKQRELNEDLLEKAEKRAETWKDMCKRWKRLGTNWRKMYERKLQNN